MQKNEDDILESWILYHANLVSFENIYLIDNQSDKKSKDILNKYSNLINIYERSDYTKKGDYIAELINQNPCDIAIPLDIDEFIGLSIKNIIYLDRESILSELENIKSKGIKFSFSHYLTSINNKLYYTNPLTEIKHFSYENYGLNNKKFFSGRHHVLHLDHGNHKVTLKAEDFTYTESKLFLFHFHYRGVIKLIEKCSNDIKGLKSVKNINDISELKSKIKSKILGYHNIETYLKYIEYGSYSLLMTIGKNNILTDCLAKQKSIYEKNE